MNSTGARQREVRGPGGFEDEIRIVLAKVNLNGGIYGLPQDSGPMVMLYNQAIFEEFGLEVPATWDEYITAAQTLHAADPGRYLTNDAGDPGAWMPGILEGSVPDGAGDWRVAPVPSYDGSPATAENGGSAQAVLRQSDDPALAAASENVVPGFQYLPFQVYANSVFPDTVGTAYTEQSDLNAGLEAWQEQLVTYGNSQGFQVN